MTAFAFVGLASQAEADLRAFEEQARAWPQVRSCHMLSGEVDFLVLGSRPVVPPQPSADAPVAVVQEFIRLRNIAREYDKLFEQAAATSIPVLNENRLRTLIGR